MRVMHPKVLSDPALRERYGIKAAKSPRYFLAAILLGIIAAWFIWSGLSAANPKVRSELISFQVIDEQSISITYKITARDLSTGHSCSLVARDIDKNIVGQVYDQMPVGTLLAGANQRSIEITTRLPAVNAGITSCQ
jgi:hypothetical protein